VARATVTAGRAGAAAGAGVALPAVAAGVGWLSAESFFSSATLRESSATRWASAWRCVSLEILASCVTVPGFAVPCDSDSLSGAAGTAAVFWSSILASTLPDAWRVPSSVLMVVTPLARRWR
jgi:hypothetical protein